MKRLPSALGVNMLYLLMMIVLLVFSAVAPLALGWRIIANELGVILLPLVLYALIRSLDVKPAFRLRRANGGVLALSFVAGLGIYLFDRWAALAVTSLLDYTTPLTPDLLDISPLNTILVMIGTAILAPVVEELFFRGVMFTAYEGAGPFVAVTGTALLFALFHMDPIQSLGLLPLVFALSYVGWRSGSVFPPIAMHFGNNLPAALLVGAGTFLPGFVEPTVTMPIAVAGLVVAGAAVWGIVRLTAPTPAPARPQPVNVVFRALPLIIAVPLALLLIGATGLLGTFPQMLSFGLPLQLGEAPWVASQTWAYDILNAADEPVGEASCTLTPGLDTILLECSAEQEAYEVTVGRSYFSDRAAQQTQQIYWDRETLYIVEGQITGTLFDGSEVEVLIESDGNELVARTMVDGSLVGEETVPPDALIEAGGLTSPLLVGEWPWRLSAMPLQVAYSRMATIVWPFAAPENDDEWQTFSEMDPVVVRTADIFPANTGDIVTWKVTVGERYTAWYSVDEPHTLIAYDDNMVTWVLRDSP